MPVDEVGDKRAAGHHLPALRANALQHPVHHPGADAAAEQGGRHFGVGEYHHAIGKPIQRNRHAAVEIQFEAVEREIVRT